MNDVFDYYVNYITEYIKLLTENKDEFFLSLCDIEDELLWKLEVSFSSDQQVVVIDNKDYSQAVRLRNDASITRIVLISAEGVKQIDSLKDFNEYSILSRKRDQIWICLERIFDIKLKSNEKIFLEALLSQGEFSFWDFLQYICESGIQNGQLIPKRLNTNLPMLGVWKSNSDEVLRKGQISRIIRLSKYSIIENRLTKAICDNKITNRKVQQIITNSLAKGSIQKILEETYFEKMQDFLKNAPRNMVESGSTNNETDESLGYEYYDFFSYEFALKISDEIRIDEIEQKWLKHRRDSADSSEEDVIPELNWYEYVPMRMTCDEYSEQFENLLEQIQNLNLSKDKISMLQEHLELLKNHFFGAWENILQATPICLAAFCNVALEYTQTYFKLLTLLITDEKIRYALPKTGIISGLQTLFCQVEKKEIIMPFYHPVCVFHYMGIKNMYDSIIYDKYDTTGLENDIKSALIQKLGMQFPIDFIEFSDQQYALDYTTVWKSGKIKFQNIETGAVYSILDFRMIQKQIIDFIQKHPFLTEITIAIVDISNLGGLIQVINKIRQLSHSNCCNIGCITFWILSSKEETLKDSLSKIWDIIGNNDIIKFRFGRSEYQTQNQTGILQYDIQKIVEEADMTVIADGSVLYHSPRMVRMQRCENTIFNRLKEISILQQALCYFQIGKSDIPILWDTLQHITKEWDDGFWRWKSKAIDNNILTLINRAVSNNADKRILALSSNKHILSEIYKIDYMQAYRQNYNGKIITLIQFDKENQCAKLPIERKGGISYSFNEFYNMTLELNSISQQILPEATDFFIEFTYHNKKGEFLCQCDIQTEDSQSLSSDYPRICANILRWHMKSFFDQSNILSCYLNDLLLNQWHEKARSVSDVLMAEALSKGVVIDPDFTVVDAETDIEVNTNFDADCTEAVKIHDIISFVDNKAVIDENTIGRFKDLFEVSTLDRILECDSKQKLLQQSERDKLLRIQELVKDKG